MKAKNVCAMKYIYLKNVHISINQIDYQIEKRKKN